MIKVISVNIRSIKKNIDELSDLMKSEDKDFAFVQEPFHKSKLPKSPGYKSIGISRNTHGGGIAIYSRSYIRTIPIYNIFSNENSKIEGIGQTTYIDKHKINMYCIYIPPTVNTDEMEVLNKIDWDNSLICGDFNSHSKIWSLGKPNTKGKCLEKIRQKKVDIINSEKIPTLLSASKTQSTPDLAMIGKNVKWTKIIKCQLLKYIGSDHLPIIFKLSKTIIINKKYIYTLKNISTNQNLLT